MVRYSGCALLAKWQMLMEVHAIASVYRQRKKGKQKENYEEVIDPHIAPQFWFFIAFYRPYKNFLACSCLCLEIFFAFLASTPFGMTADGSNNKCPLPF